MIWVIIKGVTLFKCSTHSFSITSESMFYGVAAISRVTVLCSSNRMCHGNISTSRLAKDCRVACAGIFTVVVQFQNQDQFWISHQKNQRSFYNFSKGQKRARTNKSDVFFVILAEI